MNITCISDLHGYYPYLEGGDILIIGGDLTARDTEKEYDDFWRWLCYQNYNKCIVIAGNHDNFLQNNPNFLKDCGDNIEYLCDSGTEFEGLKIYGSPWTKTFEGMNPNCKAFTVDTEEELAEKWSIITKDTDILITHSPPKFGLDKTIHQDHVGSESLRDWIFINNPKLHIFGHVHESYGIILHTQIQDLNFKLYGKPNTQLCKTTIINASHMTRQYNPWNKPIRVIL